MPEETNYPANQKRIEKQKALLVDQIKKTPVIEVACQKVGVSRTTFYRWQREDESFHEECRSALEQGTGLINDLAESKLIGQIQEGQFAAIRFWLQNHKATYGNKLQIFPGKPEELTDAEEQLLTESFKRAGLIDSGEQDNGSTSPGDDHEKQTGTNGMG